MCVFLRQLVLSLSKWTSLIITYIVQLRWYIDNVWWRRKGINKSKSCTISSFIIKRGRVLLCLSVHERAKCVFALSSRACKVWTRGATGITTGEHGIVEDIIKIIQTWIIASIQSEQRRIGIFSWRCSCTWSGWWFLFSVVIGLFLCIKCRINKIVLPIIGRLIVVVLIIVLSLLGLVGDIGIWNLYIMGRFLTENKYL